MKISNADGVEFTEALTVPTATLDGHAINKGQADDAYAPIGSGFQMLEPWVVIWDTENELPPEWEGTYELDLSAHVPADAKCGLFVGSTANWLVFWPSLNPSGTGLYLASNFSADITLPIVDQTIEYATPELTDVFLTLIGYWT